MKKVKLIIGLLLLIIASCEDIGLIEEDLPYVRLYEVDGLISPGDKDFEIRFTQTLPLNEKYDINKAALTDVNAYIWSDTQGIIPLKHVGEGRYRNAKNKSNKLQIQSNTYYELFADINGTRIYSKTKVPSKPEIISAKIIQNHIECEISGKEGEVYSCIYVLIENFNIGAPRVVEREKEFNTIFGTGKKEVLTIQTGEFPEEYLFPGSGRKLAVEVYAWDKSYKEYFETKDNNNPIGDIFSQGGDLIKWNVYGDNTIGLFMGFATRIYYDF